MARTPRLKLALLGVAVLLSHLVGLEWFGRQADAISGLRAFVPPMYTRLLKPTTPAPIVAVAGAPAATPPDRVAVRTIPAASAPKEVAKPKPKPKPKPRPKPRQPAPEPTVEAVAPVPLPAASEQVAQAAEAAAAAPQATASAPQAPAPASEAAASAPEVVASSATVPASAASAPAAVASAAAPASSAASAPAVAAASAPARVASAPARTASAPQVATAPADAALDRWPVDTRLNYRMNGQFRGPLFGDARVQWQRQGGKYQVRLDVKLQLFGTLVFTSQGDVTPDGLLPHAYEELRPGKRRVAQIGDQVVTLENGTTVKRPPGVQDTASQFVELSQRFATGKEVLAVGRTVSVWLARPGGVDQWIYDIVGREMIHTRMGNVEAFHLVPRPLPQVRGNITAEMWFAPSLQYLPVRIKVNYGTEGFLDLTADQIEQR